jgi:squalene-hopene/tetraprenyl-beta-curcumene cyclase
MRAGPSWIFFALLATALPLPTGRAWAGEDNDSAWRTRAAKSMDDRAAAWFGFDRADRGQGADKVTCVSCHSLLTYALARPALRRAAGDGRPTAFEEKLLAQVERRVAHWDELDSPRFGLFYDFDEPKKVQSRGTEAVLNALVLAEADRSRDRAAPGDATRRALDYLWATQARQGPEAGSWDWLNFGLGPWEAGPGRYFGATLAAIAVGTAPGYLATGDAASRDRVEALRGYLRGRYAGQDLHNRIWLLRASTAIDGLFPAGEKDRLIGEILAKQQASGGWSLSTLGDYRRSDGTPQVATPDGYATGLIVHALRLAGLPKDHAAVSRGRDWLRSNQGPSGAWPGYSVNTNRKPDTHIGRFMSDAATAFAVLALSGE